MRKIFGDVPVLTGNELPGKNRRAPARYKGQLFLEHTTGTYYKATDAGPDVLWERVLIDTPANLLSYPAVQSQLSSIIENSPVVPAGKRALLFPEHLSRWRAQLVDARYEMKHVAVSGHSLVTGSFANNSAAIEWAIWRERGYVGSLRKLFADRFGTLGEGYLLNNDYRVTTSGAQTIQNTAPSRSGRRMDSPSDSVTYTNVTGRYVRLRLWHESTTTTSANGPLVTIDGGSPVAVTGRPSSGADLFYASQVFDMGSLGTHTILIEGAPDATSSLVNDLAGVEVYDVNPSTATGVATHLFGITGGTAKDAWYEMSENSTSRARQQRASLTSPKAQLLLLHYITNECSATNQPAYTPERLASTLESVCTFQTEQNGGTVLLIAGPRRNPASVGSPYSEQDFVDALIPIAEANPNVAMLDVARVWGDFAAADAAGFMQDTTVHPNRLGHSDLARLVFDCIGY